MASSSRSSQERVSQRRPRHYVLAGMGVILAVSTVTIVISIILQPTDIYFSFSTNRTDARYVAAEDDSLVVVFNLTAYNPSHRAGVVYDYVLVSMQLQSPNVRKTSLPALVTNDDSSKLQQGRNSSRTIGVVAILDRRFFGFYSTKPSATINVFAQAHFKVGLAKSRVYNIRVECSRIDLSSLAARSGTAGAANCSAPN